MNRMLPNQYDSCWCREYETSSTAWYNGATNIEKLQMNPSVGRVTTKAVSTSFSSVLSKAETNEVVANRDTTVDVMFTDTIRPCELCQIQTLLLDFFAALEVDLESRRNSFFLRVLGRYLHMYRRTVSGSCWARTKST